MKKSLIRRFGELFYRVRTVNGYKEYRILFFKVRKPLKPNFVISGRLLDSFSVYKPILKNVGRNTYSSRDLVVYTKDSKIGSFSSIGQHVVIGHGDHPISFLSTSPYFYFNAMGWKDKNIQEHLEFWDSKPVEIGNDVWIGDNVFIKNGVKVGDGAIIGAKSIVTKDVPPYAIVVGNPAKIIRYRFDEKTIAKLLELKWWDLDDEIIKKIPYDDIDKAVAYLESVRNV